MYTCELDLGRLASFLSLVFGHFQSAKTEGESLGELVTCSDVLVLKEGDARESSSVSSACVLCCSETGLTRSF